MTHAVWLVRLLEIDLPSNFLSFMFCGVLKTSIILLPRAREVFWPLNLPLFKTYSLLCHAYTQYHVRLISLKKGQVSWTKISQQAKNQLLVNSVAITIRCYLKPLDYLFNDYLLISIVVSEHRWLRRKRLFWLVGFLKIILPNRFGVNNNITVTISITPNTYNLMSHRAFLSITKPVPSRCVSLTQSRLVVS